jgi:ABC-type multidrug transport system ATPase subunit
VQLSFGEKVILQGIYLKLRLGHVVGLFGRNGSGKSSLMKIMFGSLTPSYCSLRLNGKFLTSSYSHKVIGYLPQGKLIPGRVKIGTAAELFRASQGEIEEMIPELRGKWHLVPGELSGGVLRFLEAILILKSPQPFCMLDEPFTGLMPLHIDTLLSVIQSAREKKGLLISDHLYKHVTRIADHSYLLRDGRSYKINGLADLVDRGYLTGY